MVTAKLRQAGRPAAKARSLATILASALIALSVAALLVSSGLQILSNLQTQQAAIASTQQLIAQDAASAVSSFIERQFGVLSTAARLTDSDSSAEAWEQTLQSLLGLEPSFKHLILLDDGDQPLARASRVSLEASDRLLEQLTAAMLREMGQQERYVGPVFIEAQTSEPQVLIAIPVKSILGDRYGTLIADVNLKFMWDLIDQLRVGEAGQVYVVDRQGSLLAFSDTARVLRGENVAGIQVVREFTTAPGSGEAGAMSSYSGITGGRVVGSYVPLGQPDWAVVTEIPWREAYQDAIGAVVLSLGILVAVIALAGVSGVYIARRLTGPLVNLMHTATRIAGGERELLAAVDGPREVAGLATVFNRMTGELRSVMEGLEQRVSERTADLNAALAEVSARAAEQERLIGEITQQRQMIREMSIPILPVASDTLVMPLIGILDTERLADIQQRALQAIERQAARRLLLDITGVPIVDTQAAQGLLEVAQMARLLGARVVLIGIQPEVAQTIVGLGIDLSSLMATADLQTAIGSGSRR
jgi:anti-anti-sigma regulatory factor